MKYRCWVLPKEVDDDPRSQQLGYLDVVPAMVKAGGLTSSPIFESYSETITRLNERLHEQPLQGTCIDECTQCLKVHFNVISNVKIIIKIINDSLYEGQSINVVTWLTILINHNTN